MSESSSKLFSKLTDMLSETAGAASGVKKDIEVIVRSQVEKILNDFGINGILSQWKTSKLGNLEKISFQFLFDKFRFPPLFVIKGQL